ncbi:MAG: rod shape-determining protein MreD [Anaerolineae bacterium]
MTLYLSVPLLAVLAIVQSAILPRFPAAGVHVDLVLLVVVAWGLLKGNPHALVWGFFGGTFLDFLSGLPWGSQTFPLVVVAGLAGLGGAGLFGHHFGVPFVAALVGTWLDYTLSLLLLSVLGRALPPGLFVWQVLLPASLLNTLAMAAVFPLANLLYRLTHRERLEYG